MSRPESTRNRRTSIIFFVLAAFFLVLAMTDVPGAVAGVPLAILLLLIGFVLLRSNRGVGS